MTVVGAEWAEARWGSEAGAEITVIEEAGGGIIVSASGAGKRAENKGRAAGVSGADEKTEFRGSAEREGVAGSWADAETRAEPEAGEGAVEEGRIDAGAEARIIEEAGGGIMAGVTGADEKTEFRRGFAERARVAGSEAAAETRAEPEAGEGAVAKGRTDAGAWTEVGDVSRAGAEAKNTEEAEGGTSSSGADEETEVRLGVAGAETGVKEAATDCDAAERFSASEPVAELADVPSW
jgi:hypothetical protein